MSTLKKEDAFMFKDRYKRDNARITPSDEVSDRVLEAICREDIPDITPRSRNVWYRQPLYRRLIAGVACAAIALSAGLIGLRTRSSVTLPVDNGIHAGDTSVTTVQTPSSETEVTDTTTETAPTTTAPPDVSQKDPGGDFPAYIAPAQKTYTDLFTSVNYTEIYRHIDTWLYEQPTATVSPTTSTTPNTNPTNTSFLPTTTTRATSNSAPAANNFTQTNTQYADVDEADIVKTDGRYLYILRPSKGEVRIVKADGAQTAPTATLSLPDSAYIYNGSSVNFLNMYYSDDRLTVLCSAIVQTKPADLSDGMSTIHPYYFSQYVTFATIYDVSDRTAPKWLNTFGQDGNLVDSRMIDGQLLLVTDYHLRCVREDVPETFVPSLYENNSSALMAESDLCIMEKTDHDSVYTVLTVVSTTGHVQRLSQRGVFGTGSSVFYANGTHLMLTAERFLTRSAPADGFGDSVQTVSFNSAEARLQLFTLSEGKLLLTARGVVDGEINNQFSVDEYNGFFRIAAYRRNSLFREHSFVDCNTLYVLDENLHEVGRVDDLAPNESIRSVRFDGDIGYVVTFRQTDPLFTIDLSDPAAPRVLSALKITGFSSYLHPYSDGRLFGIGFAGDNSGLTGDMKLVMFNTADKKDVTVQHTLDLASTSSSAIWDHHAILVDSARGVIGFPAYIGNTCYYMVYVYSEDGGFQNGKRLLMPSDQNPRGIFIGKSFYICTASGVTICTADGFDQIKTIDF